MFFVGCSGADHYFTVCFFHQTIWLLIWPSFRYFVFVQFLYIYRIFTLYLQIFVPQASVSVLSSVLVMYFMWSCVWNSLIWTESSTAEGSSCKMNRRHCGGFIPFILHLNQKKKKSSLFFLKTSSCWVLRCFVYQRLFLSLNLFKYTTDLK